MQIADICHRQGIQISHLQIAYLFAARTDRLFSFNEALDLELVGKCLTFVQAQITSVIEPHSSRLISDGIILPNLTESAKVLPNNIHGAVLFPDKGAQKRYEDKYNEILSATGTAVLKKRAEIINADAREAAKDQVNLIEKEIRQIKSKIMNLEDLSIKSTESLVVGTDFKADEWVSQMFKLRDDLRSAEICLEIAQKIYNEYFTEISEVGCEKVAE